MPLWWFLTAALSFTHKRFYVRAATMLTVWRSHRAAEPIRMSWLNSHTFILEWPAHSFQPFQSCLIILLLSPGPTSPTETCHHFPGNVVLTVGGCCCVTWRSPRPFTDGAAPAPCLWLRGREMRQQEEEAGSRRRRAGREEGRAHPLLQYFCSFFQLSLDFSLSRQYCSHIHKNWNFGEKLFFLKRKNENVRTKTQIQYF